MFGSFEFYMTLVVFLFAFWFRVYIHYLTGYLFLLVCPTLSFSTLLELTSDNAARLSACHYIAFAFRDFKYSSSTCRPPSHPPPLKLVA